MLVLKFDGQELYNEHTEEFETTPAFELELEHSLVSLSKWEEKWEKPFLSKGAKSPEETLDYIKQMTLTPDVPPEIYTKITAEHIELLSQYIDSKRTATWFSKDQPGRRTSSEMVTAEIIYSWLILLEISFEVETWHLNKLVTLVKVINQKKQKPKKMSRADQAQQQRDLNEQRKKKYGTSG
jgi:hypothetical protein